MRHINFRLVGRTALLMNAYDVDASDALSKWRKDPKNKGLGRSGDDRAPPWSWMACLYGDSHICMPSDNLMACLRAAGAQITMRGMKTFKQASQSGIWPGSESLRLLVNGKQISMASIQELHDLEFAEQADACRKLGFRLFVKPGSVGGKKHIRVRPRFDAWEVVGTADVLIDELTDDVLAQMFEVAGRLGLGDWRPSARTPGVFGQFEAELS